MMSLKDIINKKIGVTHAAVLVFIWVSLSIMEQFVLYEPIPLENIAFFIVVILTVLKSKSQDSSQQNLLTVDGDKIEVTTEFDSLMRTMRDSLNKYERFFGRTTEPEKSMPEYTEEDLANSVHEEIHSSEEVQRDGGPW